MNILLVAINAKYIHSNLAVYSLKSFVDKEYQNHVSYSEYTINEEKDNILARIVSREPDVVAFSCYIWNREYVLWLAQNLRKVMPNVIIAAGGPEVSYDSVQLLNEFSSFDLIMKGEGEETFNELVNYWCASTGQLSNIRGITYRQKDGLIVDNEWRSVMNMDDIPFPYEDLEDLEHRIIYYESSRGCPFSCSYCLSSVEKSVRFRSLLLVKKELKFFLDKSVPQVKFVDRTFNCNHERMKELLTFIKENDNGVTNFHFEVSADLLSDEEIDQMSTFRQGLIQLEIGVQSTNQITIQKIDRKTDLGKLKDVVAKVRKARNIHQHLDLIAGLPGEDLSSFKQSFNDVYAMRPDQLQLGFLKVLTGSKMKEQAEEFGIQYESTPPYEVLMTNWLSYKDIRLLKGIEEMVEVYENSLQFQKSLSYLVKRHEDAYTFFDTLYRYYEDNGLMGIKHSRMNRYVYLMDYVRTLTSIDEKEFAQILTYDLYSRDLVKNPPEFVTNYHSQKGKLHYDAPFTIDMEHVEETGEVVKGDFIYHFDYEHRDLLSHNATVTKEVCCG